MPHIDATHYALLSLHAATAIFTYAFAAIFAFAIFG